MSSSILSLTLIILISTSLLANQIKNCMKNNLHIQIVDQKLHINNLRLFHESVNETKSDFHVDLECFNSLLTVVFADKNIIDVHSLSGDRMRIDFKSDEKLFSCLIKLHGSIYINSIEFNNNRIKRFANHMIKHFSNLRSLQLSDQQDSYSIDSDLFMGLLKIYNFDIYYSRFKFDSTNLRFRSSNPNEHLTLSILSLDYSYIEELESELFVDLVNLRTIILSFNRLSEIKARTFKNLKKMLKLDLNGNKIQYLHRDAFMDLVRLNELSLSSNNLETIEKGVFDSLRSLKKLILNHNRIKSFENISFSFDNIKMIELANNNLFAENSEISSCLNEKSTPILKLSNNKVDMSKNITFLNFKRIHSLDLSDNIFNQNESNDNLVLNIQNNVVKLKNLFLRNINLRSLRNFNLISQIEEEIESIVLDKNQLESIDEINFNGLPNEKLTLLSFQSNRINSIKTVNLTGVKFLHTLDLESNKIREVDFCRFHGLEHLKSLVLNKNPIETISMVRFVGIDELESLRLIGTRIKTIANARFIGFACLKALYLHDSTGFDPNDPANSDEISIGGIDSTTLNSLSLDLNPTKAHLKLNNLIDLKFLKIKLKSKSNADRINLTIIGLERLVSLDLSHNKISNLENLSIHGLEYVSQVDLSHNFIAEIRHSLQMYRFNNHFKAKSTNLILFFNVISFIDPQNFANHYSIDLSLRFRQLLAENNLTAIQVFEDQIAVNYQYFVYPVRINLKSLCSSSHLFLKRQLKATQLYQSIPVRFNMSIRVNCSTLFAFYRKCKLARYAIGSSIEYDSFIEDCLSEKLDPNLNL